MDKPSVFIVEDEVIISADLAMQLSKAHYQVLGTVDTGQKALAFLKEQQPDIVIMDVQLKGDLDGIDVANQVNKLYDIPVIFLTSNTDTATFNRARLSFPHAFLSKPFRIKDVIHSIQIALESQEERPDDDLEFLTDRVFIRNGELLEKVLYDDILFIEADGAYTKIITAKKQFLLSQTLKKTEARITSDKLIRIHRSYMVNIRNVDSISEGYLYIRKYKIPVSRSLRDTVIRLFKTLQ